MRILLEFTPEPEEGIGFAVGIPPSLLGAPSLTPPSSSLESRHDYGAFMSTRTQQSRSFFTQIFRPIPRDYLARRRRYRTVSTTLMILVLSLLLAAVIVYTSNPSSFGSATR